MKLTTILIIILVYMSLMIISLFIDEMKLRLAFYLIVALGTLCFINLYLTFTYYIRLRNEAGIGGPQGPTGDAGPRGDPGGCSYATKCGIDDPRPMIIDAVNAMYQIDKKCLNNPSLDNCPDKEVMDKAYPLNKQIDLLEKIANETALSREEFKKKINVCLNDPDGCL
jgi:hypothetical protein